MLDKLAFMVRDNDRSTRKSSIASGWTVEGQPVTAPQEELAAVSAGDPRLEDDTSTPRREISSGTLVLFGLLGGLYLLFTFVWFSWANAAAQANAAVAESSAWGVLQQLIFWVAPFAPAFWFVSVLVLCRGARVRRMVLWMLLGLVLLVPMPMFVGVFSW